MQQDTAPHTDALTDAATAPQAKNGLGLAGLIVGGIALVGALIPFINYVTGFIAFVGLILAVIALFLKGRRKGIAIAGAITSVVALILSIVLATVYTAGFISAVDDALGTSTGQDAGDRPSRGEMDNTPTSSADEGEDMADEAAAEIGTRANPAPLSTVIELSRSGVTEYEISFGQAVLNAADAVAAANMFNEPAPEGYQYAMLPVTFTYVGDETGTPWVDVTIEFVSAAGTTHKSFDHSVVDPEPRITDINELYPGASGTGNIVIAVPSDRIEEGTWTVSSLFGDKYFLSAQ